MLHVNSHPPGMSGATVTLEDVAAGYRHPVVHDVNLSIAAGDFVGIVGPSGAGKTTLLRTMLGDTRLFRGRVRVDGFAPKPGRGRVGYVPQLQTVDWHFPVTAGQVVQMGRVRSRPWLPWPSREDRERAMELLSRLGIAEYADRHIRQLSGGQQQRVFLARALVGEPRLLLLDEPTSGVDIRTRDEVLHLLDELNHDGITVVLTTHELNAVAAHLPRLVCINRRVVADGPPLRVFTSHLLGQTYGAEMPVLEYQGLRIVAERPHRFGRQEDETQGIQAESPVQSGTDIQRV